ncbi:MAG: DUF5009 domain-containing protein [Leadbetterella sp.]|nr:DUF5009 domain-containing protein [Leadbetterella sp.]
MNRIASIDIFRAITMCLMIFVNDFWTLRNVPKWLLHTEMYEDGMGFSDVIFPVFLVIVGMSLPFAIGRRKKAGDGPLIILKHIGERTLALVVMGFFLVNYEYLKAEELPFARSWVGMYLVTCFFLIWNSYPAGFKAATGLKGAGIAGLLVFAFSYPGGVGALKPYWWGILGLIGWSYLWAALAYLWAGNNLRRLTGITLFFLLFCVLAFAGYFSVLAPVKKYVWLVENGALPFLCMLGVLASVFYQNRTFRYYVPALMLIGVALIGTGFFFRPYWGISKILATPAWICICGGIAYVVYALLFWIMDVRGWQQWSSFLKPAGIATLTCYLVPYYWYAVRSLTGIRLPEALLESPVGLLMSMGVSLIIIQLTGLLIRWGVKLKV